ncbi:MAG: hypothetical protein ACTHJI_16470 [Leifsonia sp.]
MSGRTTSSALIWLVVGIGIRLAGLMVARAADWLGHSGGVSLVSYTIGASLSLAAVAAVSGDRRAYRAAVARSQARARWKRQQAAKQRVRFIDPEQDS